MIIIGVIAVLGLGLGVASWLRPTHAEAAAAPQYSDQQVADAKKNICAAFQLAEQATDSAAALKSDDPNQKFMISINTRLAFDMAASHLLSSLDQNPAGSSELVDSARKAATTYQRIILSQTASASDDQLKPLYRDGDTALDSIGRACG